MNLRKPWLIPLLLLLLSLFTGFTFGTSWIVMGMFCLATTITLLCRRDKVAESGLATFFAKHRRLLTILMVFFVLVASAGWRLVHHLGDTINPLAYGIDAMAHIAICQSLLLAVLHPKTGHPGMLGLGLLIVMLSVSAGGASQSLAGQVSVALLTTLGFLFASRQILHDSSIRKRNGTPNTVLLGPRKTVSEFGRTGLIFMGLCMSLILMATSGIAHVTSLFLPDVQGLVHAQLQQSLDAVTRTEIMVSSKYVHGSRLGSVRKHIIRDSTDIAFNAYSEIQPGYLRGTAFDVFNAGQWFMIENQDLQPTDQTPALESQTLFSIGPAKTRIEGRSRRPLKRFRLQPFQDDLASLEIHNKPLKGRVYFSPLKTRWIEANAHEVRINPNGILEYGIDGSSPYVLGISPENVTERLDPKRRKVLTFVSPEMRDEVEKIATTVCAGQTSTIGKAIAIQNFFQSEFTYSLRGIPTRKDPITHFLETKHPAHCEYFASATAIMLRTLGVPTRYVTGYVATEFSTDEDSWVARNRDAHAWVEAFDDASASWFAVESTPGRSYQSISGDGMDNIQSTANATQQNAADQSEEGFFSRTFGWLLAFRATDPLILLFRVVQVPLFLVAVFFLWKRFLRGGGEEGNPDDIKSLQMLRRVDRKLRKHDLVRAPHETMHQFADRVEAHSRELDQQTNVTTILESYAQWYRGFADARYQGRVPEPLAA